MLFRSLVHYSPVPAMFLGIRTSILQVDATAVGLSSRRRQRTIQTVVSRELILLATVLFDGEK